MAETAQEAGISTGAETCYWRRRRGMTGVMKNRKNNVLPFVKPPEVPDGTSTIICQAGGQRFAVHMQWEDLPPPLVMAKRRVRESTRKNDMRMETTFLRLRDSATGECARSEAGANIDCIIW